MATRAHQPTLERYADGDLAAWLEQQAGLIREGRWAQVDALNVAEELEDLGRSYFDRFVSALRLIMSHRLKLRYQPGMAGTSWRRTIAREIVNAETLLEKHPSFRSRRAEALAEAYRAARREAELETGLPRETFPHDNPFSWEELTGPIPDVTD